MGNYLNWTVIGYDNGVYNIINHKDKSCLTFIKDQIDDIIELLVEIKTEYK